MSFYDITTKIKEHLNAHSQVSTVTEGDIFEVDLAKQTIFPLSHIMINNVTFNDIGVTYNMSILFMDVADVSKGDLRDEAEPFSMPRVMERICSISSDTSEAELAFKDTS